MRALGACALLLVVGCTAPAAPAVVRPAAGTQQEAAETPRVALASCGELGLLGCALSPGTPTELCGTVSQCIVPPADLTFEGLEVDCEPPRGTASEGAVLSDEAPAPEGAGLGATGMLNLAASEERRARYGASYLVAQVADGWCLVDNVLDWLSYPTYFQTELETRWEPMVGGFRLLARAHRIGHESLDEEDLAAGESDVTSELCNRLVYEVIDGRFTRVSRSSIPGACQD